MILTIVLKDVYFIVVYFLFHKLKGPVDHQNKLIQIAYGNENIF